ncbi:unnamed protein product [Acanthoscelides obtectus]|uniref:Uncharacterized protein n=1 Tax=Acanthoscelides obtectus TaxID=200917 RepID=A0A9P0MCT5_ACAOB|nr:unnamed protein product [Acanthoscelides obtectus]CAK1630129.1 UPF0565 protein C2orf69 homolog [Acanthoscelides obtectus]
MLALSTNEVDLSLVSHLWVGVGALVFGYTLVGAVSFMHIEKGGENVKLKEVTKLRGVYSHKLYQVAEMCNIFEKRFGFNMTNKYLPTIIRLLKVHGFEDRYNDIVYCRPLKVTQQNHASMSVFFGGDVQDFTENMQSHRDNKNYLKWNLENTAILLRSHFPDSHIIVIKPSRMEFKTFSCYKNFVKCNSCGVPEHSENYNSLMHLQKLLDNICDQLKSMSDDDIEAAEELSRNALVDLEESSLYTTKENEVSLKDNKEVAGYERTTVNFENLDLRLIGFSKGCVVLNQFLHELNHYSVTMSALEKPDSMSRIKDMYWLDGGHNGGKNTWITAKALLATLAILKIRVHVHVSPYQIKDERRPWIGKEEKSFTETAKDVGVTILRTVHFEDLPPTLNVHFDILKVFANSCSS